MKKPILMVLIMLAIIAFVGLGFVPGIFDSDAESKDAMDARSAGTFVVKRQNLEITLVETGHLKAKESQDIKAPLQNRQVTIVSLVEEGKVVELGEELIRFDDKDLKKRVEELEQERIDIEASLKSATSDFEIKQTTTKTERDKAALDLENAKKELAKALGGTLILESNRLEIRLRENEFQKARLERKLEQMVAVHEAEGMFSKDEIEETKIQLEKAANELKSTIMETDIFKEYTRGMDEAKRRNDLSTAESAMGNVMKKTEAELASSEANLRKAQRRLERNQEQLDEARADLEKMVVKSPGNGIVVFGNPDQPWRDAPKVGGTFYHQETILTLPYLTEMQVQFDVHESDIAKLKLGQKVRIKLEMDSVLELTGEVSKIGALATGGGWREDANVRKFKCEVTIDQKETGHKPGLTSKVEIMIGQLENVIVVPVQAVHTKEGKHIVYLAPAENPEARDVEVGSSSVTHVEIKSGLNEGDRVLLFEPEQK